jgi:PIF1 helicase.
VQRNKTRCLKNYEKFDIGKFKGNDVLIPRMPLMPTDYAFEFKRVQFPACLAIAKSINKSQGKALEVCGINLELPCF